MNDQRNDPEPTDDRADDAEFERIARRAAAALRRPAPAGGVEQLARVDSARRRMRLASVGVVVVVAVVAMVWSLSGRRGPEASGSPTSTQAASTPTTEGVSAAMLLMADARDYAEALLRGSAADVNTLRSSTCNGTVTDASLERIRTGILHSTGRSASAISIKTVTTRNVSSTAGEALVTLDLPAAEQGNDNWLHYHVENGRWRLLDCEYLPFGGSSDVGTISTLVSKIELDSTHVRAGDTLKGALVVTNSGASTVNILSGGCTPKWGITLSNDKIPADGIFTAECGLKPLSLPVGETRIPVTIVTTYSSCVGSGGSSPTPTVPTCTGDGPPPLPTGDYTAVLVGVIPGLTDPPAVDVTLTP